MAAWILITRGILIAPVIFLYGATLDRQRLEDRIGPLVIDHEMDARITPYVVVVRASEAARTLDTELQAAEMWRKGRRSGVLRDPMPARYGDDDMEMGVRRELVAAAELLSERLLDRASRCPDRTRAERLFLAALEPLRTVQYADTATFTQVTSYRTAIVLKMRRRGFSPREANRDTAILRPETARLSQLYRHMARLRNLYRARNDDEDALWNADPAFEAVVQGEQREARFLARR